jgi:uncharacterized membrane-anchored protein YhcB (DUF1043 family)
MMRTYTDFPITVVFAASVSWTSLTGVLAGLIAGLGVLAKLFMDAAIKEGVKAQFDRQLESRKAALDLQKQQALKDFGLFADKKHQANTVVYSALRSAYRSVNAP